MEESGPCGGEKSAGPRNRRKRMTVSVRNKPGRLTTLNLVAVYQSDVRITAVVQSRRAGTAGGGRYTITENALLRAERRIDLGDRVTGGGRDVGDFESRKAIG